MKFKKVAALFMASAMTVGAFTACGNSEGTTDGGSEAAKGDASESDEEITLRYAAWDLGTEEENNINRRMIKAYEEAHPNIKIEIATDIDTADWNGSLSTAAAGGSLPDVALIGELPTAVANGWALDVTEYIANDADWANIPSLLTEAGKFGSGTYGIPSAMNITGLYVNKDLFEQKNQPVLTYGYTFEDFDAALKNMSAPSEGIASIKVADISDWYPAVKDDSVGFFTLKDGKVDLTNPLYIEGIKYSRSIYENGYSFNSLTDEQKANFGVDGDWEAFNAGKVAMAVDPTSNAAGYSELASEIAFTSLPNGKCILIPDYAFISATTEHPQEAYDFLKFMTFSKEGIMERLNITEADTECKWGSLPLNTDSEIVERFFKNYPMEGVQEVYENMEGNAIVEPFKFTPGYANAHWNALTGISAGGEENANVAKVIESCINGELNIDDYAEQLNTLANAQIKEVQDIIDTVVE